MKNEIRNIKPFAPGTPTFPARYVDMYCELVYRYGYSHGDAWTACKALEVNSL